MRVQRKRSTAERFLRNCSFDQEGVFRRQIFYDNFQVTLSVSLLHILVIIRCFWNNSCDKETRMGISFWKIPQSKYISFIMWWKQLVKRVEKSEKKATKMLIQRVDSLAFWTD